MFDNVFAGLWSAENAALERFAFTVRIECGPLAGLSGAGEFSAPAHLVAPRGISVVGAANGMGLTLTLLGRAFDVADADPCEPAPRAALRDGAPVGLEAAFALGTLRIRIAGGGVGIVEAAGCLPESSGRLFWGDAHADALRAAAARAVRGPSAPPPGLA